jgi:hypothetical protein
MRTLDLPRIAESPFRGITTRRLRGAPAVVLMLILVGCSSGSGTPAAPTTQPGATPAGVPTLAPTSAATAATADVDACKFLTPAEVSAAYGQTVKAGEPSADDLYAYCTYKSNNDKVTLFVTRSSDAAAYFQTVKINKGQAVSGVGDEAYWGTDSFLPGLYFLKGGTMAYLSGPQTGPEDPIVQLGKLLASRM